MIWLAVGLGFTYLAVGANLALGMAKVPPSLLAQLLLFCAVWLFWPIAGQWVR